MSSAKKLSTYLVGGMMLLLCNVNSSGLKVDLCGTQFVMVRVLEWAAEHISIIVS